MNEPLSLTDGTVLPKLEYEGRARASALEEEDREALAWYAASLEDTILRISAFLSGYDDVAEVARRHLRQALAKGATQ